MQSLQIHLHPAAPQLQFWPQFVSLDDGKPYGPLPIPPHIFSHSCRTQWELEVMQAQMAASSDSLRDCDETLGGLQMSSNFTSTLRQDDVLSVLNWTHIILNWCYHLTGYDKAAALSYAYETRLYFSLHLPIYLYVYIFYFTAWIHLRWPSSLSTHNTPWMSTTIDIKHQMKCPQSNVAYHNISTLEIWLVWHLSSKANRFKLKLLNIYPIFPPNHQVVL